MARLDFGWFAKFWRQRKGLMGVVLVLTVFSIIARTAYPLMFKFVLDQLAAKAATGEIRKWVVALIAVGLYQGLMFAALPNSRAYGNLVFAKLMRESVFDRILRKGYDFFLKFRTGDIITRLTDDIESNDLKLAWYSCSGVMRPIEMSLVILFSLGVMFSLNWKLSLLVFLPLPLLIWAMTATMKRLEEFTKRRQKSISHINDLLESAFSGIRIVKGYHCEPHVGERLTTGLDERILSEIDYIRANARLQSVITIVQNFGSVITLLAGGVLTVRGEMSIGSFFAFATYFMFLVEPIITLGYFFAITKINFTYVARLKEVEEYPEQQQSGLRAPGTLEHFEFREITARYPGSERKILDKISFKVKRRQTVAVVGPIGCGKTTLLEVGLGELAPEQGQVFWNDDDITTLNPMERAKKIGLVTQEPLLFSETIVENVRLGHGGLGDAAVAAALRTARFTEELEKFPAREHTLLGQRGIELSGGQKQRLSLARALAHKPELLLLDDVTSALDAETEQKFWKHFRTDHPDTTVLVVTHRLATAAQADRVIMLEEGKIVADGPHIWLMKHNARYRAFVEQEEVEEAAA